MNRVVEVRCSCGVVHYRLYWRWQMGDVFWENPVVNPDGTEAAAGVVTSDG